jgi:type IV pilus assembly protein PilB
VASGESAKWAGWKVCCPTLATPRTRDHTQWALARRGELTIRSRYMGRPEVTRERIGDMLLASGLISRAQLDEALAAQRASRQPVGKQLVALGYVRESQLVQVLSNQLSVPWVSLDRIEFSAELLARLPADLADRYSVMPVYVRNAKGRGETLYVAMDDPSDEEALAAIGRTTGLKVRAMIASPSELRGAIEERYFGLRPSKAPTPARAVTRADRSGSFVREKRAQPAPAVEAEARGPARDAQDEARAGKPRPPPPPKAPPTPPRIEGAVPVDQYVTPSRPPNAKSGRTLTLLDGTRIQLPATKPANAVQPATEVRHVVKAVSAASTENGHAGPVRWHDVVQALIDAAAARGVTLTRKEIAEAWRQARARQEKAPPSDG